MCHLTTESFTCGHQEASNIPCTSDTAGQCMLQHTPVSSLHPCEDCDTDPYPIIVANIQTRTEAFEESLLSALGKITLILDECLYHSDISDFHLRMMDLLIPKIESKLERVRERSRRAWDLLHERDEHLEALLTAVENDDSGERDFSFSMLEIVQESLDNLDSEMASEMTPAQLLMMWKGSCQLDYCWWVLQNAAVVGEMRASGRLADVKEAFEGEYPDATREV